ncbi:DMT family transporter [Cohaesibacter celericrescens]|uniref:EamA family transporter n=1 Tax=Cohaesibacter celericrescens TaxID=2067669 RepID=A0A2N5XQH4_9HYPH|nr:DMT family transporter [Cohaesibacter celericrescens]PLW76772.1 EamA family transporter [Cohaesibacter celericrescens]
MSTAPRSSAAGGGDIQSSRSGTNRGNLYGILMMQLAIFGFVTNDTMTKMVGADLQAGQLIFVRGIFAFGLIFTICLITGQISHYRQLANRAVWIRSVLEGFTVILFVIALLQLPLANLTAIMLTVPMATTALAAIFLGEKVGIHRWSAVFFGFVGVLIIVRPGTDGFNFYSLFALCAVVFAAVREVITRNIPASYSTWIVTLGTMIGSSVAGILMGVTETWGAIETENLLYLAGSAIFFIIGHYFLVIGMSHGEISVVSSFRYSSIFIALIYGYVIWSDIPDAITWLGIALIMMAGLYTIYRQRKIARQQRGHAKVETITEVNS